MFFFLLTRAGGISFEGSKLEGSEWGKRSGARWWRGQLQLIKKKQVRSSLGA